MSKDRAGRKGLSEEMLRRLDAATMRLREREGKPHWDGHPPPLDLALYASGELSTQEMEWVLEHLKTCELCSSSFQQLSKELQNAATQEDAVAIADALLTEFEDTQRIRMPLIHLTETMLCECRKMLSPVGLVRVVISANSLTASRQVQLNSGPHGVLVENAVMSKKLHPRILIAGFFGKVVEMVPMTGVIGALFTLLPNVPDLEQQVVELTTQGFEQGEIAIASMMPIPGGDVTG